MIPYGKQSISKEDIDAVINVLQSEYLTQGPAVPAFEKAVSGYCGANYAIAVNSATSALHLACLALGVGAGDIVWTTPITFVASANCALYCGAKIDFVDIDTQTYNMSTEKLSKKLKQAQALGKLPKVVIPVHLCGQSCDMKEIHDLSQKYGFKIIEDASHAIGGKYKNTYIGNCKFSDITVFSFHPVKIITTGEGGMALTNNFTVANKMERLRSHGITRDASQMTKQPDGSWYYQQIDLGFNYRITDIQAALGNSQLKRLDDFVKLRHKIANSYFQMLQDLPIKLPDQNTETYSSFHLFPIRLELENISRSRQEVFDSLRKDGVGVNIHYIPVHTQPYYQNLGFKIGDFPEAEQFYSEAISLPIHPTLSNLEQQQIVDSLTTSLAL